MPKSSFNMFKNIYLLWAATANHANGNFFLSLKPNDLIVSTNLNASRIELIVLGTIALITIR